MHTYEQFGKLLLEYEKKSKSSKFDIDFLDADKFTPLHYACQYDRKECTKILLLQHGASIDLSSEAGLRPRDMLQYDEIKKIFIEYFEKIDNAFANDNKLHTAEREYLVKVISDVTEKQRELQK